MNQVSREFKRIMLFNMRIAHSRRLWHPELKDMGGKPYDNPRYSATFILRRTKDRWSDEPELASLAMAVNDIYNMYMSHIPPTAVQLPIKSGDIPNTKGVVHDWAKGHWVIKGDTSNGAPTVKMLVNGAQVLLPAPTIQGSSVGWNDGDFCCAGLSITKRANDAIGIKCYLNDVLFTAKGDAIKTGAGDTDWDAALKQAQAQGIAIKTGSLGAGAIAPFPGSDVHRPVANPF